jgi:hypothetical protein
MPNGVADVGFKAKARMDREWWERRFPRVEEGEGEKREERGQREMGREIRGDGATRSGAVEAELLGLMMDEAREKKALQELARDAWGMLGGGKERG